MAVWPAIENKGSPTFALVGMWITDWSMDGHMQQIIYNVGAIMMQTVCCNFKYAIQEGHEFIPQAKFVVTVPPKS